jgi:hypothetical protein
MVDYKKVLRRIKKVPKEYADLILAAEEAPHKNRSKETINQILKKNRCDCTIIIYKPYFFNFVSVWNIESRFALAYLRDVETVFRESSSRLVIYDNAMNRIGLWHLDECHIIEISSALPAAKIHYAKADRVR